MSSGNSVRPNKKGATNKLFGPVKLQRRFNFEHLESNNKAYNAWLSKTAECWQLKLGREVFTLIDSNAHVKAYYCLSVGRASSEFQNTRQHKVILLSRMAISEEANVLEEAERLLRGALIKAAKASQTGDYSGLIVHATDERLVGLYAKFGFVGFQKTDHATLLVKSMKAIRSEAWLAGHID